MQEEFLMVLIGCIYALGCINHLMLLGNKKYKLIQKITVSGRHSISFFPVPVDAIHYTGRQISCQGALDRYTPSSDSKSFRLQFHIFDFEGN